MSDLAARARQVADAAPLHQSAAVLRECADEIDRLSQDADTLGALADRWAFDSDAQARRADKAEADLAALRDECDDLREEATSYRGAAHDGHRDADEARKELAALREAVRALPEYHYCGYAIGSPLCKKHCLLSPANAALAAARKLAGLGE